MEVHATLTLTQAAYKMILEKIRVIVRGKGFFTAADLNGNEIKILVRHLGLKPVPNAQTGRWVRAHTCIMLCVTLTLIHLG